MKMIFSGATIEHVPMVVNLLSGIVVSTTVVFAAPFLANNAQRIAAAKGAPVVVHGCVIDIKNWNAQAAAKRITAEATEVVVERRSDEQLSMTMVFVKGIMCMYYTPSSSDWTIRLASVMFSY